MNIFIIDSPGAPPSATAHELFRGFSYIAPVMLNESPLSKPSTDLKSIANVRTEFSTCLQFLLQLFIIIAELFFFHTKVYMFKMKEIPFSLFLKTAFACSLISHEFSHIRFNVTV